MLNLICTWCEESKLQLYENMGRFYVGCSNARYDSCPNTTGEFRTAQEAIDCAKEYVAWFNNEQSPAPLLGDANDAKFLPGMNAGVSFGGNR
jgi:hypothetical protein